MTQKMLLKMGNLLRLYRKFQKAYDLIMGLLKNIETKYGVNANYWHISETNIFWKTMRANIIIDGYLDRGARLSKKRILDQKSFNIDISSLMQIPITNAMEMASAIYQLVKYYIQEFEDAINIIEEGQKEIDISTYLPIKVHIIPTKPIPDPNSRPYYPPDVIMFYPGVSMLSIVVDVVLK